jgi:hypothetical protein
MAKLAPPRGSLAMALPTEGDCKTSEWAITRCRERIDCVSTKGMILACSCRERGGYGEDFGGREDEGPFFYRAARVVALLHLVDEATIVLLRIHPICVPAAPSSVSLPLISKGGSDAMRVPECE